MAVIKGLEEFEAQLKAINLSVQQKMLMKTLKKNVEPTRALASQTVKHRTGASREKQIIATVPSLSGPFSATVRVGPARSVFYDFFQEHGTVFETPDPYLKPAYEATKDQVYAGVATDFKNAVEKYNSGTVGGSSDSSSAGSSSSSSVPSLGKKSTRARDKKGRFL